ncbi:ribonucleoside triphosphate reductase [Rhodopseudomonas palustris]|uniref:Ribonucleoside triphosphate reductase n=1 Tax=Thiospirillum jenense TaxID=1653858 RepID=A0A839HK21_9GAMM|nr:ribonucleoside triphosphate reductase [Thiospirillum jenense]MBB1093757.1 ribonucleoside triphosphate reductase [Rhodopseudomonas palustris]MBB1127236.1 ribonucleoside triphosphate reductase [Thiospirillum jenense]
MNKYLTNLATLPMRILKRDGQCVTFDPSRIELALLRAGRASGEYGEAEVITLTAQVIKVLAHQFDAERIPTIEHVQDVVEQTLITANYFETARSYIVYREQHRQLRVDECTLVDVAGSINEYLDRSDWRVSANANQGYSLGGLILNTSGKMVANYWLNHVYTPEIGHAHREGDLHIHDLDMLAGYCAGWSLRTLLREGLNGVPGRVEAGPPRHMSSAIGQIVNFLGTLQNEWAGAQAFSSFDTYMAPYVRVDQLNYSQVRQYIQELIYNLNVPSRWGTQCVDAVTECLTEGGWKRYDQLTSDDRIATVNWRNNCLEYLHPLAIKSYEFDGEMYVLRNGTQEQWITPKHKVLQKVHGTQSEWALNTIEDVIASQQPVVIPHAWQTNSTIEINDAIVELYAWSMAAAYSHCAIMHEQMTLSITLNLNQSAIAFSSLLMQLELDCQYLSKTGTDESKPVGDSYQLKITDPALTHICLAQDSIHIFIRTLSARQIRLFLSTYATSFGQTNQPNHAEINVTNQTTLNVLQELCVLAGYGSLVSKKTGAAHFSLQFINDYTSTIQIIEQRHYKGYVWCPTTHNGTFIARRNGKTFVTGNTPFTNLTFDWVCPEDLRDEVPVIGNIEQPFTYSELQVEMDMINRAYIEVMTGGDAKGRIFTFPIPTYNITKDFPWDSDNARNLFEMTAKYGLPYFQNFLNSELTPNMVRSMCCRLQLDLRELLKRGNGLFGSAEQTGSLGVVTINCARLGYLYRGNERKLFARLDELLELSCKSLEIKRKVIQRHLEAGLFPYTKRYLGTLRNHFSTIGVNGVNEMIRNFTYDAEDITTLWGQEFACRFLDMVRTRMIQFQEQTGHMYNLEATPAEGTTYRFAREDSKRFPNILQAGSKEAPYYTNSSQLPAGYTDDPFEALFLQEKLQSKYTGGTVLHLYMSERISSPEACKRLVRRALENFRLPYLTITPVFSICPHHGYIAGEHEYCPYCDQELVAKKCAAMPLTPSKSKVTTFDGLAYVQ